MKMPIRRPNFKVRHTKRESYAAAVRDFRDAVPEMTAPREARAVRETVAPPARPLPEGAIPPGFSLKAITTDVLRSAGARIVSEHEGAIGSLLLTVPKAENGRPEAVDARLARHYRRVLSALHDRVHFVIVAAARQRRTIERWLTNAGVSASRVTFVDSPRFDYSLWAQDAYVTVEDRKKRTVLVEGVSFQRAEDSTIADDIAAQSDIASLPSYLYFQGGNVLGGSDLTLIGIDYVWRNTTRFRIATMADAVAAFEDLFGTPVLALGGARSARYDLLADGVLTGEGFQPIFHIDMYVTRTGVIGPTGREVVFLGRPGKAKEVTGRFSNVRRLDNSICDGFFEETAGQLAARFEVRTLPLWMTFGNLGEPGLGKKFYNLSFNNSLVENAVDGRRVLLPSYSSDARGFGVDRAIRKDLEQAAEAEWRGLGFDVTFMDGLEDLAYGDGSVHCMTKTLRRSS
jgi:hypothetical protein